MSGLIGLLLVLLVGCVFGGAVLAIIALIKTHALERQIRRLDQLESAVARLTRREQVAERPQPPPAREPAVPQAFPPPAVKTPPAPRPPRPPRPPRAKIDWERWVGIRGAAALGAVALALAGLLFFKYSIEHGLITPVMRVVLGAVTGLGSIIGSEWLRRRGYRYLAEGVSGAGVVILYAAFWAAHVLYGLIGMVPAFVLMGLVTVVCVMLALRHKAFFVAVLGLVGGFATPLLLSSGTDRPIGLFGYVLLLDLGLLVLGHKRRWPSLGAMSLLATVGIEALWIGGRMGPDRLLLGLAILAVFATLFVFSARVAARGSRAAAWVWSQAGAIFFPFVFAVYFAARVDLGAHLVPIALLMAMLGAAASWISREREGRFLGLGAAAATVAVIGIWLLRHPLDTALSWEVAAVAVGLAALFHGFVELDRTAPPTGPAPAALLMSAGMSVALLFAALGATGVAPWPWIAGWFLLAALTYRHASFPKRAWLKWATAAGLGLGLSALHVWHHGSSVFPSAPLYLALLVGAAVVLQVAALLLRRDDASRAADLAAVLLPVTLLFAFPGSALLADAGPFPALAASLTLGLLAVIAATRLGSGVWFAIAMVGTWLAQLTWTGNRPSLADGAESIVALALQAVSVLIFTAWPLLGGRRFASMPAAVRAAALAAPLWFVSLHRLFDLSFGDSLIGLLPLVLAGVAFAAVAGARRKWAIDDPLRRIAIVWFGAVALCFVSVAVPLQLEREWVTIGWALQGLAVLALWKRLDHPGLKYFALALFAAVAVRLVANPALLGYHQRSAVRVFNWLLYTYLVPATAMLAGAALLRPLEACRLRPAERKVYGREQPLGAVLAFVGALIVIFVWINLSIADWFSTGQVLTLSFGDMPAQRLTVSLAWAAYALVLLALGMIRSSQGLRWISLGFLMVAIVKVFLYDLGALQDLYRVGSLVGAAVSLLLVSFLYQRFVFRRDPGQAS